MKKITITVPKGWRKGRTLYSLIGYIGEMNRLKGINGFIISDSDFDKYVKEFIKENK